MYLILLHLGELVQCTICSELLICFQTCSLPVKIWWEKFSKDKKEEKV